MNILISGGCGFIGVNLVNYLLRQGDYKVSILDNLSSGNIDYLKAATSNYGKQVVQVNSISKSDRVANDVELLIGDIRDKDTCVEACKEVNAVVHLAAHTGVVPSIKDPYFDFEVNVLGTLNLLHASVNNGVDKFIFASSNAPLGDQSPPMSEKKAPAPLSPYGASKLACEGYCSAFHGSYNLKTVALRFSNAYGPYSLHKNSVIARFLKDATIKRELTIYGDGAQTRDFIHVEDLCNAIYLFLSLDDWPVSQTRRTDQENSTSSARLRSGMSPIDSIDLTGPIWGGAFNLGTGKETSILELASYVKELVSNNIKIVLKPERKGEIKKNYSNISKVKALLGFEPQIDIRSGIQKAYEWFISQPIESAINVKVLSRSD